MEWGIKNILSVGLRSTICKLSWWAAVYHLWLQRNAIVHDGQIKTEEQILNFIKKDVKARIEIKGPFPGSILNRALCCNWGINPSVLKIF